MKNGSTSSKEITSVISWLKPWFLVNAAGVDNGAQNLLLPLRASCIHHVIPDGEKEREGRPRGDGGLGGRRRRKRRQEKAGREGERRRRGEGEGEGQISGSKKQILELSFFSH